MKKTLILSLFLLVAHINIGATEVEISYEKDINQETKSMDKNSASTAESLKRNNDAGEYSITVPINKSSDITKAYVSSEGVVSETYDANSSEVEILNGKIISTDSGIVQTRGGYDKTIYIYEDLNNLDNKVPLSGGAFDAIYLGTQKQGEDYYVNVQISGLTGYIALDDVQIIPTQLIKSQTYYENISGEWVFNEAIDPLMSDSYDSYTIDTAPDWASEGQKYYSYDNVNYYTDNMLKNGEVKENYTYFKELPFTSTSDYTASNYKSYLSNVGHTDSMYYNSTSAFVDAQNLENINSLVLFAMANHEGAYGTSNLSKKCNNFFGWGAYDSDPNNACESYGYPTARDGILSQSLHLTQMWGDITDFRFEGTEVGDKSHGINVYYASDSNWGIKVASQMYNIDKYLGSKDINKFRIYEIKNSEPVYSDYTARKTLKVNDTSTTYTIPRNQGFNPRVLVTSDKSDSFEIQLPTPKNNSSSTTCKFTDANKGTYPNYDKTYTTTVPKGVGSFGCAYGSWSSQKGWYPKKDANGSITYNVISDVTAKNPGTVTTGNVGTCDSLVSTTILSNGDKLEKYNSNDNETCEVTYYGNGNTKKLYKKYYKNEANEKYKVIQYKYDSKGIKTYYSDTNYSTSSGYITNYKEYYYNSRGTRIQRNEKTYYSNGKPIKKLYYHYDNGVEQNKIEQDKYDTSGHKTYYSNTNYSTSTGRITNYKEYYYNTRGTRIQRNEKTYYSNGKPIKKLYYHYDNGKQINKIEQDKYDTSGYKTYYSNTNYSTSTGRITDYKEYYYNTRGTRIQRNEKTYHSNGSPIKKTNYYYTDTGSYKYSKVYYY